MKSLRVLANQGKTSPSTALFGFLLSFIFFATSCGASIAKGWSKVAGTEEMSSGVNSSVMRLKYEANSSANEASESPGLVAFTDQDLGLSGTAKSFRML